MEDSFTKPWLVLRVLPTESRGNTLQASGGCSPDPVSQLGRKLPDLVVFNLRGTLESLGRIKSRGVPLPRDGDAWALGS